MDTLFPEAWLQIPAGRDTESDPLHTFCCEAVGVDAKDEEVSVVLVPDSAAVEACRLAQKPAPPCDEDGNLDVGFVLAVFAPDHQGYARLVFCRDGIAESVL